MNLTMAQLLAQLNENPQIAAALADSGAHNHPALGPLAGLLAPAAAQPLLMSRKLTTTTQRQETRFCLLLWLHAGRMKPKEMLMLIKDGIKHGLWRRIKIIKNLDVRRQSALILLEILDFKSMQGDSIEATQAQDN